MSFFRPKPSPEKYHLYRSIFNRVDEDENGAIDLQELKDAIKSDAQVPKNVVKNLFKRSDKDGDGRITFKEFVEMVHDSTFKELWSHGINSYIKLVVPPQQRLKLKRKAADALLLEGGATAVPDEAYEERYSCWPPPLGIVFLSLLELAFFIVDNILEKGATDTGRGVTAHALVYNPYKRRECWRLLTYIFVHIGIVHLAVNLVFQVLLAIPLEMTNKPWRVLTVYFAGAIAGSLTTSVADPRVFLAGASGGVYALITAHLATVIMNWKDMMFPGIQLSVILMIVIPDVGVAVYNRYYLDIDQNIGYAAHFGGAVAGLLVGIWILVNVETNKIENLIWWGALLVYVVLMAVAIFINIFWTNHFFSET